MYNVDDMPPIDGGELEQLIDEHVQHREYLFFRRNPGDDLDPFLDTRTGMNASARGAGSILYSH